MRGATSAEEAARVEALRRYQILDTPSEKAFDDLSRLSAQICGTPIALISFVDQEREWIKSRVGTKATAFPYEISFCAHAIRERDLLIVRDALFDERFAANPLVKSDPNIRFYAGAPLLTPYGLAIGALCIIDHYPRELNSIQCEALRIVSRQVMAHLEIRKRDAAPADSGRQEGEEPSSRASRPERKQAEEAVRKNEAKNRALLDAIPDMMFRIDPLGRLLDFKAGRRIGPKTEQAGFAGKKIEDLFPGDLAEQALYHANHALHTSEPQLFEYQLAEEGHLRDYEARIVVSGENEVLAIVRDITEKKAQAAILEHQALYDALTDLPNRALLHDRLQQAILVCHREQRPLALLLMDLDHFKEVNDTLGHHFGDILLRHMGSRLRDLLRESDTIARLGGDEFAVLLPTTGTGENAIIVATKILKALEAPFVLEGQTLYVGASIGIALYPGDGEYADLLIQRADVAMYVAKQSGGGYATYSAEADQNSLRKLALKGELRQAIDGGELFLLYQPKIDLQAARVSAVEALVRWRHPQLGVIPPDQFITLAEHAGLIKQLALWVLNAALRQCRAWHQSGLQMNVAVNLSVRNLQDPQLPDQIAGLLEKCGVPAGRLELEITESVIMADPNRAMDVLTRLDKMGIGLAIDDFGTGYSSLGYLKKLPVDTIKIDKSFIKEMVVDRDDAMIVRSTIDLGHNLGLKAVAEGVENQETWTRLLDLGCDMAQGYYISRPISPDELTQWLSNSPMGLRRI